MKTIRLPANIEKPRRSGRKSASGSKSPRVTTRSGGRPASRGKPSRVRRVVVEPQLGRRAVTPPDAGLCGTCNYVDTCTLRARQASPVLYCEEFDVRGPVIELPVRAPAATLDEPFGPRAAGLCVNCAHRATCTLPRPEGGVWHCEEYA